MLGSHDLTKKGKEGKTEDRVEINLPHGVMVARTDIIRLSCLCKCVRG